MDPAVLRLSRNFKLPTNYKTKRKNELKSELNQALEDINIRKFCKDNSRDVRSTNFVRGITAAALFAMQKLLLQLQILLLQIPFVSSEILFIQS
ncbi:hypothetical protein Glove_109g421 [Diversispora epigaea]|uniref:Uncharacterized protein n=1 Tax=Diversispora epigaea TaxID=1348612 RepID=A0A397J4H3_9GLOM|nr:hypothetical protein Glove_109g421 [Diversispora epigaea]